MGSLQAQEMSQFLALEPAITWHLRSNHYPPVPFSMVPVCVAAIDAVNEDDWDRDVELPEGVSWRGQTTAPAYAIVEAHHLDAWINQDDSDWEDES